MSENNMFQDLILLKNPDGSCKVTSPEVRAEVYTSTRYNQTR